MADREPAADASTLSAQTGIAGLDDVLRGGFRKGRLYLIEGVPGSGKTTLATQFLLEGIRRGEPGVYITLNETAEELRHAAATHGWSLEGITIIAVAPSEDMLRPDEQYTLFHPSEVELSETNRAILAQIEQVQPSRVVLDSLSELRLLAGTPLHYRRQVQALKQYFSDRQCTVLLLDDLTTRDHDLQMQSISHGVLRLELLRPEYGTQRRRLVVVKYRGVSFRGGYHDFIIREGGLEVFPRLIASEHPQVKAHALLPSGMPELDALLGGGIPRGTSTLIVGAAGAGKSSLATRMMASALQRGEGAAMFVFDENISTLLTRSAALGMDLQSWLDNGRLIVDQINPAEKSPGELTHMLRRAVESQRIGVVVIDSLNGYLNAMPEERFLLIHLHELLMYLSQMNMVTILIAGHAGLVGGPMQSPVDASYLADTVILLRYYEAAGEIRQAISVIKKRSGAHERTIREFRFAGHRLAIGPPLSGLRGVLSGVPIIEGAPAAAAREDASP